MCQWWNILLGRRHKTDWFKSWHDNNKHINNMLTNNMLTNCCLNFCLRNECMKVWFVFTSDPAVKWAYHKQTALFVTAIKTTLDYHQNNTLNINYWLKESHSTLARINWKPRVLLKERKGEKRDSYGWQPGAHLMELASSQWKQKLALKQ